MIYYVQTNYQEGNIMDIKNLKEELKGLDMGVLVTKATSAASKIDFSSVKDFIDDLTDGATAEKIKGAARTASDFGGYVKIIVGDAVKSLRK